MTEEFAPLDLLESDRITDIRCEITSWLFQSNYYNLSFEDTVIKIATLHNEDVNTVKEICINKIKELQNED